jgi:hypothetical protein
MAQTLPAAAPQQPPVFSFPAVRRFCDVCREMGLRGSPAVSYVGTVKLHGTHGDVQVDPEGGLRCFSRNRELSPAADNMGFCAFVGQHADAFRRMGLDVRRALDALTCKDPPEPPTEPPTEPPHQPANAPDEDAPDDGEAGRPHGREVTLCGEWCGRGVQRGVAIAQLDRFFVVLAVRADGRWQDVSALAGLLRAPPQVHCIWDFQTFSMVIDFADPAASAPALQALTDEVDRECPVARQLGAPPGPGEGIVWAPAAESSRVFSRSRYWFKTKGAAHQATAPAAGKGGVRTEAERVAAADLQAFLARCATPQRAQQGLALLDELGKPRDASGAGVFIRWFCDDVWKEERASLEGAGVHTSNAAHKLAAPVARRLYFETVPDA